MESQVSNRPSRLARHIRDLRTACGMTLAALAEASGVSRASLSRIENDEVSPTADTLARLSSALKLPISQLIAPLEDRFEAFIPRDAQPVYSNAGFTRRSVSPPAADLMLELVECSLTPKTEITYDRPSFSGHEHHFVLLEGLLDITVDDVQHSLRPGDSLRYRLNGRSAFRAGPDGARYLLALA